MVPPVSPEIVYLHIPKTAGKSQQLLFTDIYGEQKVFWHPGDGSAELDTASVIGGHRHLDSYEPLPNALFVSVVRDPLDRVLSHFNWIANPEYGKNALWQSRINLRQQWVDKGLVPESLDRTLEESKDFRNAISNIQCRYLSRYEPTFSGVQQTLTETSWVIGRQADTGRFSLFLAGLLGNRTGAQHQVNRTSGTQRSSTILSDTSREIIEELNAEDRRLYDFISDECEGLYWRLSAADSVPARARAERKQKMPGFSDWRRVSLRCANSALQFRPGEIMRPRVEVSNPTAQRLYSLAGGGVCISYRLYDASGDCVLADGERSLLLDDITAGGSCDLAVNVRVPEALAKDVRSLRYTLSLNKPGWFGRKVIESEPVALSSV